MCKSAASKNEQSAVSGRTMSTGFATVLLLGIELALFVPLVLAWFRPRLLKSVPIVYGLAALALGLHQTGLIRNDLPAGLDAADLSPQPLGDDRCAEMIDALKQAGAVSQDSRPGDVEISPELWQQIPEQIREAIAPCIESGDSTQI